MECYRMAESKYKFYLSFEDAICKDYATEKFFSIFGGLNLIPVVLGGANYSGIGRQLFCTDIGQRHGPRLRVIDSSGRCGSA